MRIKITTTLQVISDDGQEIFRAVSKDQTSSFDLSDTDPQVSRRVNRALTVTKERVAAALSGWLQP